jgi:hypothetical protein
MIRQRPQKYGEILAQGLCMHGYTTPFDRAEYTLQMKFLVDFEYRRTEA